MEYLPGIRLVDGVRAQFKKYAEQQGKTLEELESEQKEKVGGVSPESVHGFDARGSRKLYCPSRSSARASCSECL
jgi:hypothetical protein